MKKTNNKEVRKAIREHIMDYCENDYETFEANAKAICNQREDYLVIGARKLAEAGEFIISHFDARAFLEEVLDKINEKGINSIDDIDKNILNPSSSARTYLFKSKTFCGIASVASHSLSSLLFFQ